ncbi:PREDICTED: uncharacterized protein LOC104597859 [Nelumbo nucifera]|uniref:Uncharacterized protein LOC104597859 n=1 Tax=Nelumbo nucifera TaxID=4432 RepID=A0A1U7ZW09_NELNU|nr:PREDICTED: uncharacterized protein LOC104597859 [Nelumbo nucifera]
MSKQNTRKHASQRNGGLEREKPAGQSFLSKHLKKVYPLGFHKSASSLSLSSLSLSQNSNDSSFSDSISRARLDRKVSSVPVPIVTPISLRGLGPPDRKEVSSVTNVEQEIHDFSGGGLRRCNWITKNSDKAYVVFHDEQWGVPIYNDNQLFEMLALSGLLMDHNWSEIVKRKELYREAFGQFNPSFVAKLGEKEIREISSNEELALAESRVRCIIDNSKCIIQIVKEFGSFSSYIWAYMDYKPMISYYRYPRNVPLRTPKAEAISKDLLRRGFRFVGPVIVYSFMQASGMTIDHLVDCFRFSECVSLAERPFRHG